MKPMWSSERNRRRERRSDHRTVRLRCARGSCLHGGAAGGVETADGRSRMRPGRGFTGGPTLWRRTTAKGALAAALTAAALLDPADYADAEHRILVASNDHDRLLVSRDTPPGEHDPDESEHATLSCGRHSKPSSWRERRPTCVMRCSRPGEAAWIAWAPSDAATPSAYSARSCSLAEHRSGDLRSPRISPAAASPTRRWRLVKAQLRPSAYRLGLRGSQTS